MELIEKKDNQIIFISDMTESLANSIRRSMSKIPVLAVDELEFSKNDSPLYDETIAHRVGLVPIKHNKKEGGKLKLSTKKEGIVYSGELKGDGEVIYDKVPLTLLSKGQELEFTASLKIGKGYEHSKFNPGLMFYREISEITLNKEILEEIKKIFPKADINEKGNKITVIDNKKDSVLDICEEISDKKGDALETNPTNNLMIHLESFGQLDVHDIFKESIGILKKDLSEISKKIK